MNVNNRFIKEIGLISNESYEKLRNSLIVLFGLGGVGGYTFEALVRAGIENFIIIDKDSFDETNINRQLAATSGTLSKDKIAIYKERAVSINDNVKINGIKIDINNNVCNIFNDIKNHNYNSIYAIDCIDDINAKIEIIKYCYENKIKIISSMGTANHIKSDKIKITDINKTEYCPVAKILRKKLKEINVDRLDVLYIDEEPIKSNSLSTISYMPAICGLKIAEYVINNLTKS